MAMHDPGTFMVTMIARDSAIVTSSCLQTLRVHVWTARVAMTARTGSKANSAT